MRRNPARGALPRTWLVLLLALLPAARLHAQARSALDAELRDLRDATSLEVSGDLAGAERVLRSILTRNPLSLSALLSLERVLTLQGRTAEILPLVDGLLERDPTSAIGHQMRVRACSMLNDVPALEKAADAWIAATPDVEIPYREIARVWRDRHDPARAVHVLEEGKERIQRADALALELGDAYADLGDMNRAVREWSRAIGREGAGFLLVQRRLMNLPNGGAAFIQPMLDALTAMPTTAQRERAAVQIAIGAGLAQRAAAIAHAAASRLHGVERQSLLLEVARRADGAGLNALAYWAYNALLAGGGSVDRMLAVRNRLAELALALGDTARAATAYRDLEKSFAVGSPERRQALAVRVRLLARDGDVAGARHELAAFRKEFPEAPETDALAGALADALLEEGDVDAAEDIVAGVTGPHSGLARGRVYIRRGDIERARAALLASAPALRGAEATETIALATLLGRLSADGGELVGSALARESGDSRDATIEELLAGSRSLAAPERAAILEFAAQLADRSGLADRAEQVRREIIAEYPHSVEAPGALLAIARTMVLHNEPLDEARLLLERLILDYPRSALVPQARRELDRLQGRGPGS